MTNGTEMVGRQKFLDPLNQKCQQFIERCRLVPVVFVNLVLVIIESNKKRFVASYAFNAAIRAAFKPFVMRFGEQGIFQAG